MRLFYFHELGRANFGDDLNRWMWPSLIRDQLGTDDGVYLSGIGTIVNASLMPQGKKWIVLGSGAGYGYPPLDFGGDNWRALAVRGPLSAEVLHLPVESAITDAAILLREVAGMEQAHPRRPSPWHRLHAALSKHPRQASGKRHAHWLDSNTSIHSPTAASPSIEFATPNSCSPMPCTQPSLPTRSAFRGSPLSAVLPSAPSSGSTGP